MTRLPRVLVVDDSAFARTVLSRLLRSSGSIEVIGSARDGRDALEKIAALDPDVITLDLTMPELDGIGVLHALRGKARPRVVVVSISGIDTELGAEALLLGAVDLITKPTALASDRLLELGNELIAKVSAAAASFLQPVVVHPKSPARSGSARADLVMIGTSTGGPQALTRVLAGFTQPLSVPIVMVLHIPPGYTQALAARLDKVSPLRVLEASDGLALEPGMAALAPSGTQLTLQHGLRVKLAPTPVEPFMPSVNQLFTSGAAVAGAGALGVVLTGMGDDGLVGARAIAAAGGSLLTESASTCVVYGMPRSVFEADIGAVAVPIERMAEEIAKRV
jgi:two-component system chemotaxis response regulator CheB